MSAFFRFSAPERPVVAVRFTAFVPVARDLVPLTVTATLESETPKGAGEVSRPLLLPMVFSFSFVGELVIEEMPFEDERGLLIDVDETVAEHVVVDAALLLDDGEQVSVANSGGRD